MEMDTDLVLDIDEVEEDAEQESRTYKIDFESGCISGMIDGLEAVEQAIVKILLTERYKNLVYSDDYGCEVLDTMMSDENTDAFLEAEIPDLIADALADDERILSVDHFEFYDSTDERDGLKVTFDVSTIYGELNMEGVF